MTDAGGIVLHCGTPLPLPKIVLTQSDANAGTFRQSASRQSFRDRQFSAELGRHSLSLRTLLARRSNPLADPTSRFEDTRKASKFSCNFVISFHRSSADLFFLLLPLNSSSIYRGAFAVGSGALPGSEG